MLIPSVFAPTAANAGAADARGSAAAAAGNLTVRWAGGGSAVVFAATLSWAGRTRPVGFVCLMPRSFLGFVCQSANVAEPHGAIGARADGAG
jgi:hypothetical protein